MNVLSTGEKIRKIRKSLDMTLKDLAGNRVTTGQISLIESGKSKPSMDLLEYLSIKLGTSIEYLLESEQKQAKKICDYYENMAVCYLFQENILEVESYLSKMLLISEKYNLEQIIYKSYFIRGLCLYKTENYDLAVENFLLANFGFLKFSMNEELINSLLHLANISVNKKNYISAIIHLKCAIKIIEKYFSNYDLSFFSVYYLISKSYAELGNMDKSNYYLKKLIYLLDKIYKPKESALIFMEKSIEHMELEDVDNAIKFSCMSRKYFEDMNLLNDRQVVENHVSRHLIENNELNNGKKYLKRAESVGVFYEFDNLFEIYKNFINLYIKQNDINKVKYYLIKLEGLVDMKNFNNTIDFYMLKYKFYILEKNYADAEVILILAYNFSKDFGEYKKAGDCCLALSKFYLDMKRVNEAENIIKEAFIQYKKIGYKMNL